MTNPNWGLLGNGQNALAMFAAGNQMGQQMRERQDKAKTNAALGTILRGGGQTEQTAGAPAMPGVIGGFGGGTFDTQGQQVTPADGQAQINAMTGAWNDLWSADPRLAMQVQGHQQTQAANQQKTMQTQMQQMGRLLDGVNEQNYGERLQIAQQMGLDVSKAPPVFDQGWAQQQQLIARAFNEDGGQSISGLSRELTEAGFGAPGSETHQAAMVSTLNGKYGYETTDARGRTVRRSALDLKRPAKQLAGPPPGTIEDGHRFKGGDPSNPASWEPVEQQGGPVLSGEQYQGAVGALGGDGAQRLVQRHGYTVGN